MNEDTHSPIKLPLNLRVYIWIDDVYLLPLYLFISVVKEVCSSLLYTIDSLLFDTPLEEIRIVGKLVISLNLFYLLRVLWNTAFVTFKSCLTFMLEFRSKQCFCEFKF